MLKYIRSHVGSILVVSLLSLSSALSFAAQVVNINTADALTLAEGLTGIGASKAQAIVEYRDENGLFESVDDLVNVQGIGAKTLEQLREFVTVSGAAAKTNAAAVQPETQPALQAN